MVDAQFNNLIELPAFAFKHLNSLIFFQNGKLKMENQNLNPQNLNKITILTASYSCILWNPSKFDIFRLNKHFEQFKILKPFQQVY